MDSICKNCKSTVVVSKKYNSSGVVCRVGRTNSGYTSMLIMRIFFSHTYIECKLNIIGIWEWGIHSLNRWEIYDLVGGANMM